MFADPPTLVPVECPLDSNDMLHWECAFCGFSKLPAEWENFYGHPEPLMPTVRRL